MSAGATLLKLQQIDLELARNKSELANMPELKELASKRKTYVKLKAEMTKLYAQRKDLDIELDDLNTTEIQTNNAIEAPRSATLMALTTGRSGPGERARHPGQAPGQDRAHPQGCRRRPQGGTRPRGSRAGHHRQVRGGREGRHQGRPRQGRRPPGKIDAATKERTALAATLPTDVLTDYERLLKQFRGLAVETIRATSHGLPHRAAGVVHERPQPRR
ncbi:MAG: hypothetical protein ACLU37_06010 [Collinsella sp.]